MSEHPSPQMEEIARLTATIEQQHVKPSRDAIAKALFDVRDDPFDTDEWGELSSIDRERWETYADAILALLPGKSEAEVKAEALREAVADMRASWRGSWNLPDPEDPEVAYSVDSWLEVRAERIRG